MSDALSPNAVLSPVERWLARLGIRPDEKEVTALLFGNMFLSGIAIGMIRVVAFTLFLKHFGSEQLALVAVVLAFVGTLITLAIDRVTSKVTVRGYLFTVLGTVLTGLLGYRILLAGSEHPALIFTLPVFFEVAYTLFSLQFIALLSRLLNVRQTKRLAGMARSGEFLAELVGGLSIALLLNFIGTKDLLLVAALATCLVATVVFITIKRYRNKLILTTSDLAEQEESQHDGRMLTMFRSTYVRLIALCYSAYIFSYFFLEVAFYEYASVQFPTERTMAEFIGQFSAVAGFLTLIAMVFLFGPFLRRLGILAAIIAYPIVIATGSSLISIMEFGGMGITAIFTVMVLTNGVRFILQAAIWRPSIAILFQVLPDRQRSRGTALIEGLVDPVAGGIAGICLYLVSDYLAWPPKYFLIILTGFMVAWIWMGLAVRRRYLSNLVVGIQQRKLGEMSLSELDTASLNIIKQGLESRYPAEIFYCLNLLEEIDHPEITELIKRVMPNHNHEVRMDVLRRIARLDMTPLISRVRERMEIEPEPAVRGQALKTYAALRADDTVECLTPFLSAAHEDVRRGALAGILGYDPGNDMANELLLGLVRSKRDSDRNFAAEVLSDMSSTRFSGYLTELLDDPDTTISERAIFAAGQIRDERLAGLLVQKMGNATLQAAAHHALKQYGEVALYELELALTSPESGRQEKINIMDTIREIGGPEAVQILLRQIDVDSPDLRHQVYLALAHLHYQADPDEQYVFADKLNEEVANIAWLLASMEDLYQSGPYQLVHNALGSELDVRRDNLLLLCSFLFPSVVMLDTRANIDSRISDLRVFALEVLDNVLTTEIKQVVLPILDDLTVAERLRYLQEKFPQEKLEPSTRFNQLVDQYMDNAFYWTRACVLYQIGQDRNNIHQDTVSGCLDDPEPVIRETAIWALWRLEPPDLQRSLRAHLDDPSPQVAATVGQLIEDAG